jgi:hypothetical protein
MNISLNKTFIANTHGRDFIVGDIHGQLDDLISQLKEELFDFSNDRLFALGDLIDRGEQSRQCLELLNKPWFFSIIGNHEYIFLDQLSKQEFDTSNVKVGNQWLEEWLINQPQLHEWSELIKSKMSLTITLKYQSFDIGLVHAKPLIPWPVITNKEVFLDNYFDEIWNREEFYNRNSIGSFKELGLVIMGHNQVRKPTLKGNRLWIDTKHSSGIFSILDCTKLVNIFKGTIVE